MDHGHSSSDTIRFSNSPRKWTQVVETGTSPTKSVHPPLMESLNSQADFAHRTVDFFDDESSEGEHGTAAAISATRSHDLHLRERSSSPNKRKRPPPSGESFVSQCEPKRVTSPLDSDGYRRLDSNLTQQAPGRSPTVSYNGSIDDDANRLPIQGERVPQFPKSARISDTNTDQNSRNCNQESPYDQRLSTYSQKQGPRIGVHYLAHDILLQGLLADEELMHRNRNSDQINPRLSGIRHSMLPPQLRPYDPRSPKDHLFQRAQMQQDDLPLDKGKRKVHMAPPPIDTTSDRKTSHEEYVRTPYPFNPGRTHRKDFDREPLSSMESPAGTTESVLTLSVRKSNRNSRTRVTTIAIPPSNDYSVVRSTQDNEKLFKSFPFDDEQFFHHVRKAYIKLTGPTRFFSARSLARIVVSGSGTRAADAGYGWFYQPRSPRVLAYKGLTDSFSEDKILQLYRKPARGKSRYAFVSWAHRLAAIPADPLSPEPPSEPPSHDLVRRIEQPEGLEFIVSWSILRIVSALVAVVLLSVAAALLWIFLGKNSTSGGGGGGGFMDAGDRVATGVLMGICVFVVGMSGVAGWLGVSWLVI